MENLKKLPFLAVCVLDVVLFIISISVDLSVNGLTYYQGIWCGMFYLAAGALGLFLAFVKQSQLIAQITMITALLAAVFGTIAAGLSGHLANDYFCIGSCNGFYGKEWALMVMSVFAVIDSVILAFFVRKSGLTSN